MNYDNLIDKNGYLKQGVQVVLKEVGINLDIRKYIADVLGCSESSVRKVMSGERRPPKDMKIVKQLIWIAHKKADHNNKFLKKLLKEWK